jgi:hypothetical protein
MAEEKAIAKSQLVPIQLDSLKTGMLIDRPLYLFFPSSKRYIQIARPLHLLEQQTIMKIRRIGNVYSTEKPLEDRFPDMAKTVKIVRDSCESKTLAPFEKNAVIEKKTEWLAKLVLKFPTDVTPALFFFHRLCNVPAPRTLIYVSDLSVDSYERCLKLAAVSSVIALWLGFHDLKFLGQLAESIFVEEVGGFQDNKTPGENEHEWRGMGLELVERGKVPGVSQWDHRFKMLMADRIDGDELGEIVTLARGLLQESESHVAAARYSRVAKKLMTQFPVDIGPEKGAKAA